MAQPHPTPLPPAWADHLLGVFCPSELQEELLGDLHEQFEQQVTQIGESTARRLYVWEVIRFCRPYLISRQLRALTANSTFSSSLSFLLSNMLRNYLKIALRSLAKNQVYSFINISGLAVGMAVAMLIGLWV
ncbi:permease prefix domain 2-containing transporter [Spirosoma linguale]|uniref:permease prefix domain 2-containing transporter n=1 Tax=Spirosoma linguale TaxID=108 RepID=UPI0001A3B7D1